MNQQPIENLATDLDLAIEQARNVLDVCDRLGLSSAAIKLAEAIDRMENAAKAD